MATTYELMDELRDMTVDIERLEADMGDALDPSPELVVLHDEAMKKLSDWYCVAVPSKVAAILAYTDESKAQVAEAKRQSADWAAVAKRRSARVERGNSLALLLCEANGGPVHLPAGRVAHVVERKSVSVNVTSLDDLTSDYCRVTTVADKNAIKTALKAGVHVTGAELVEKTTHGVRVKDK